MSADLESADPDPEALANLLNDTSTPALMALAERYGLKGVWLQSHEALVEAMRRDLPPAVQARLMDELVAARYGALTIDGLLTEVLTTAMRRDPRTTAPVLEAVSESEAELVEEGPPRWRFTIRGHSVTVDAAARHLACDCRHFEFAGRRGMLCKHLAMAFRLMPEAAAREALIALLVTEQYGGPKTPRWRMHPS